MSIRCASFDSGNACRTDEGAWRPLQAVLCQSSTARVAPSTYRRRSDARRQQVVEVSFPPRRVLALAVAADPVHHLLEPAPDTTGDVGYLPPLVHRQLAKADMQLDRAVP